MFEQNAISAPDAFNDAAFSQEWQNIQQEPDFKTVQPSLSNNFAISAQNPIQPAAPAFNTAEPEVKMEVKIDNDQFLMDVDNATILQTMETQAHESVLGGLLNAACELADDVSGVSAKLEPEVPVITVQPEDIVPEVQTRYTPEKPSYQPSAFG